MNNLQFLSAKRLIENFDLKQILEIKSSIEPIIHRKKVKNVILSLHKLISEGYAFVEEERGNQVIEDESTHFERVDLYYNELYKYVKI